MTRNGMSIMTEVILVIGILLVAGAFLTVTGDILGQQTSQVLTGEQRNIADDIASRINTMEGFKGETTVNYQPGIQQYTLHVKENSVVEVQLPNKKVSTTRFENLHLENTVIENEETICIHRDGTDVSFTPGNCTTVDLSNFCANNRCVNGVCDAERGETCSSDDCDCTPEAYPDDADTSDVSDHCGPGYEPADYIDGTGPGTVDPLGCVDQDYVGVQDEGDRCDRDFECSQDMVCNEAHPGSNIDGSYCCPAGQRWNGQECASPDVYDIVFVPLNYNSGEYDLFRQKAEATFDTFLPKSPFRTCSNPEYHVRAHYLDDMGGGCGSSGPNAICDECPRTARDRVLNSNLANTWDKIVGICKGNSCSPGTGICGCAMGIPGDASATNQINCGSTPPSNVGVHEMGHTQGLYHVEKCGATGGCTGPNAGDCAVTPESRQRDFFMSYCNQNKYGPDAYSHLENDVFADNLQGCSP